MGQSLWKIIWHFLLKLKLGLPYNPAITLCGIEPTEMKTYFHMDTKSLSVHSSFVCDKDQKPLKHLSRREWLNTLWSVWTKGYDSAILRNERLRQTVTWMNFKLCRVRKNPATSERYIHVSTYVTFMK